jgi:hypothetical protein
MADKNSNKPGAWFRRVNNKLDDLDNSMNGLYQTTYASRSDNKKDMDSIVTSIDDTIDKIITSGDNPKISDISNLYTRIQKKKGVSNQQIIDSAMELFADNNIVNTLSVNQDVNKYIQAEDYQYDMICKYMPSIETALEIKRDNVLSSDNFTKDFLNIEATTISDERVKIFNDNAKAVQEKYKFQDICEEMYERASKYGECFLYIVPYNIALQRLVRRRAMFGSTGLLRSFGESFKGKKTKPDSVVIFESAKPDDELKAAIKNVNFKEQNCSVNLIFDDSAIFAEAVETKETAIKAAKISKSQSINESYNALHESKGEEDSSVTFNSVYDKKKSSGNNLNSGINDGLTVTGGPGRFATDTKIDEMNGCVVAFIERGDILPIYMDNLCIGYYHFTFSQCDNLNYCQHDYQNGTLPAAGNQRGSINDSEMANDMLLSFIAQRISDNIDSHFINANKDLKEEIYAILKYNDKFSAMNGTNDITVSFLPAEDVYHFFLKQDKKTHRGISTLRKALIPAMLYCLLYLTNTIGQVTRAQDKRIYYVRQNVETNVARTLMNVINQIKRGNMGMRQIESMNSILGVVGKYNDHVIPLGQSGDAPIQFEVMQGQNIETPTELMERFNNDAVASTDVPYEFVQSVNQVDYATRFTMSNSKFLRKVYKEQRICQNAFSEVFTKIYNFEYNETEKKIKILLPAPAFLSMTNTEQLINNTKNYINAITEVELGNESDEVKTEFTKIMMRSMLGNYIDYDSVDEAVVQAKMRVATNPKTDES